MRWALLLVTLAACPPPAAPKTYDVDRNFTVSNSVDATWAALVDVFAEQQWKIDKIDKSSGLITSDWMLVSSYSTETVDRYVDCGGTLPGVSDNKLLSTVRFNIVVRQAGNNSAVTVNAAFQRRVGNGLVECVSTGQVEQLIQEKLRARAREHAEAAPKDGRKTVAGDKPLYCALTAAEIGLCFLDENACNTEATKVGVEHCEVRKAGSCFNATRT